MNTFIKKQDFNFITRCLMDFYNTLKNCSDKNIIEANRLCIQNKIYDLFDNLSLEQKDLLKINIIDPLEIHPYLLNLNKYVYGMEKVSESQIKKLFKKEKKLKMPPEELLMYKNVYLSWFDEATNKMLVAYKLNDKLLGMTCRVEHQHIKSNNMCALCNKMGSEEEIAYVSSPCKMSGAKYGNYKSIGFHMCLDSRKCNDSITSIDKLVEIIKEVNGID